MCDLIVEYLFCGQFAKDHQVIDLLEDLATKKQKCSLNVKNYGEDYYKLYMDVLKHYKLKKSSTTKTVQQENLIIKNWSAIRKKAVKDLVLKNFIIDIKNKYKFTEETTTNFKKDLSVGLNFKNINDKNIIISNNKIVAISGLHITTNHYEWTFDLKTFNN
ncbi:hypothetical protein DH26_gp100 [Chloriridovirus anopheles1]|uniref:Uncharacterized protein n=1 Tax=Chloriridovirus anopheles1 TaxID=1465751 RepID=W8QN27_9VIRU|nr:hypothetical protein DH26_gp100 [Anopheles minimus iridovirus]AHL67593.1 hypothetical protein AMIV_100 [Anopheles minimus iridovirus]